MDIGPNGRMVVGYDPSGANIDLWQVMNAPTSDVDHALHGAMSWCEVMSHDVARDTRFSCDPFGWTAEVMPMPGFDYTTFKHNGEFVAGMMALTPDTEGVKPYWCTYFTVEDVEKTAREAEAFGGTIAIPVTDVAGVGRFCGITSP